MPYLYLIVISYK